jgi:Xaa-Pro aminopeptidase
MNGKRIAVDPDRAVAAIFGALQAGGAQIVEARDPTILPKAVKNPIEQSGHRAAQAQARAGGQGLLHLGAQLLRQVGAESVICCHDPDGTRRGAHRF